MKKPEKYNYDKPIKLLQYKSPRFDIIFYSSILSLLVIVVAYLILIHDGKFEVRFDLWRVLICIPLIILSYIFKQLLDELRVYPKKLMAKHIWTIDELMKLTNKNRKETENIMNHVLESCFIVDNKNKVSE